MFLLSRRHDLGDDPVAVGDDDRLAGRGPTNIFAELVLQKRPTVGIAAKWLLESTCQFMQPRI
jgi:hypothetical protein